MVNTRNSKRKAAEQSVSLVNNRSLELVTPRENTVNERTWWMVDLYPVDGISPQGATALVKRCMRINKWNESLVFRVLAAYRQFLQLKKIHKDWNAEVLSPCYLVDQMWHCHILDVVNYYHDMILLCGHVVGRNADLEMVDFAIRQQRAQDTRVRLEGAFGQYDESVWDYSPNAHNAAPLTVGSTQNAAIANSSIGTSNGQHASTSLAKSGDASGGNQGPFTIVVKDIVHGEEMMFKIKRTTQMFKVFNAYARMKRVDANTLLFMFRGKAILPHDTATTLALEDEGQIDCFLKHMNLVR